MNEGVMASLGDFFFPSDALQVQCRGALRRYTPCGTEALGKQMYSACHFHHGPDAVPTHPHLPHHD